MVNLIETRKDVLKKDDLKKLAANKDEFKNIEIEFYSNSKEKYDEAVKKGFKGTYPEFIKTLSVEELRQMLAEGGLVDFSSMSAEDMKAIFRSIMGRNPKDIKELVRIIKLDMKGMDDKGLPYGAFE